jgi:hypothetical protein
VRGRPFFRSVLDTASRCVVPTGEHVGCRGAMQVLRLLSCPSGLRAGKTGRGALAFSMQSANGAFQRESSHHAFAGTIQKTAQPVSQIREGPSEEARKAGKDKNAFLLVSWLPHGFVSRRFRDTAERYKPANLAHPRSWRFPRWVQREPPRTGDGGSTRAFGPSQPQCTIVWGATPSPASISAHPDRRKAHGAWHSRGIWSRRIASRAF